MLNFVESALATNEVEHGTNGFRRVGVVPGIEAFEGSNFFLRMINRFLAFQVAVDAVSRFITVADGNGNVSVSRNHVAAGVDAGDTGSHEAVNFNDAFFEIESGNLVDQALVDVLSKGQNYGISLDGFEFAGGMRISFGFSASVMVESHFTETPSCRASSTSKS